MYTPVCVYVACIYGGDGATPSVRMHNSSVSPSNDDPPSELSNASLYHGIVCNCVSIIVYVCIQACECVYLYHLFQPVGVV